MRKVAILLLSLITLTACATKVVYIAPELPEYSPIVPERPELEEIPESAMIPAEVNTNLALVMGYAEKLEAVIDSWEVFYNDLCGIYKSYREAAE